MFRGKGGLDVVLAVGTFVIGCLMASIGPVSAQTRERVAPADAPSTVKVFLIGNSLTWDALPALLSGDVSWHIDCGKSLQFIYDHPAKPCVGSSKSWPQALRDKQFDFLCVQPHDGTNLQQDIEVISHWIQMQPRSVLVLHTGWARCAQVEIEFTAAGRSINGGTSMVHAPAYFTALASELRKRHPGLQVRSTEAAQTLHSIAQDVSHHRGPLGALSELYRDEIHLTQDGRYLAHNLLRQSLGQPISSQGFQLEAELLEYLNQKIAQSRVPLTPQKSVDRQ